MRLIDADALEKEIRFYAKTLYQNIKHSLTKNFQPSRDFVRGVEDGYCRILFALKEQPTIDPVKHGRWIKAERQGCWSYADVYKQCSECGKVTFLAEKMNYCPNCGARMEGEEG